MNGIDETVEPIYALYCNDHFVVAKPMFTPPTSPRDFGVGELPTSTYAICQASVIPSGSYAKEIIATIEV